jgi:hypothetical protein
VNRSTYRTVILILGLFTALVHLILLNVLLVGAGAGISPIFILNGLGYLAFLWVFFRRPSFLIGRRTLLHVAFMGYTAVTILAWFVTGALSDPIGIITKLAEVLLIAALFLNLRAGSRA